MNSRSKLVLAVVLVIGLAGCSGLSPFGSGSAYPDGYNESEITDPETAAEQHNQALSEYDSYTQKMNITSSNQGVEMNMSVQVDESNKQASADTKLNKEDEEVMRLEMYQDGNTTYEKTETPLFGTVYNTTDESFSTFLGNETNNTDKAELFSNANFEEGGTVTRNDETLYRYNATEVDDPEEFINLSESSEADSVESFNATLLVDEEGIMRSLTIDMTTTTLGETQEISAEIRITDLDSTTVEEPDWLEEAESEAQAEDTIPYAIGS